MSGVWRVAGDGDSPAGWAGKNPFDPAVGIGSLLAEPVDWLGHVKGTGPLYMPPDTAYLLPRFDLLHTRNLFLNGIYPFIDYSTGGDIESWIVGYSDIT
jgi:hypothetical protein